MALGVTSATFFIVGWAWDHRYAPLSAVAPIVALVGLALAAMALRRDRRGTVPALIGGALSLLVLLGYAYALLDPTGGN